MKYFNFFLMIAVWSCTGNTQELAMIILSKGLMTRRLLLILIICQDMKPTVQPCFTRGVEALKKLENTNMP